MKIKEMKKKDDGEEKMNKMKMKEDEQDEKR